MKITKVKPVVPSAVVTRRKQKDVYKSEIDPAVIIHSNKTHRTSSEAFRDAEYACSITKFKNDWQLSLEFLGSALFGMFSTGMVLLIPVLLVMWLTK